MSATSPHLIPPPGENPRPVPTTTKLVGSSRSDTLPSPSSGPWLASAHWPIPLQCALHAMARRHDLMVPPG